MQIQHSDDDLQYLGWNCNSPARQQLQNLCCNQGIHVILLSFQLCKTQIVFLNPLAGSIQKTAECIFHVHSRLMATRTSRSNLEIEFSNILISEAIFVFIFSGCKTYLSVRSFVEGISAPSDHYPHHPKHYENISRQV